MTTTTHERGTVATEQQLQIFADSIGEMPAEVKSAEGPQKRLLEKLIELMQHEAAKLKRTAN
jgi:hypothetical protein